MQDLEISHQNPTLEATTVAKSTIHSVFTVFWEELRSIGIGVLCIYERLWVRRASRSTSTGHQRPSKVSTRCHSNQESGYRAFGVVVVIQDYNKRTHSASWAVR